MILPRRHALIGSVAALAFAAVKAKAQMPLTGVGAPLGGGACPPNSYVAGATAFDGSTSQVNFASLTEALSPSLKLTVSCWVQFNPGNTGTLFVADPTGQYWASSNANGNNLDANIAASVTYPDDAGNSANWGPATVGAGVFSDYDWHHCITSMDLSLFGVGTFFNGAPYALTYVDGVLLAGDVDPVHGYASQGTFPWNGRQFMVGNDTFGDYFNGNLAEFYFAPDQCVISGGAIDVSPFIDSCGKPVDLGSDGSTPTGIAPAIYLRGGASTFGTNLGTGGSCAATGLTDAPTHP